MAKSPIKIEFVGIDDWSRPTFKSVEKLRYMIKETNDPYYAHAYFCDTENLFGGVGESEILDFYRKNPDKVADIIYKGREFDSEPCGTRYNIEIKGV